LKHLFEDILGVVNVLKLEELCRKIEQIITPEVLNALENLSLKVIQENI